MAGLALTAVPDLNLTEAEQQLFSSFNIHSSLDFLFFSSSNIPIPSSRLSEIKSLISAHATAPYESGSSLLLRSSSSLSKPSPTSLPALDQLLKGGYHDKEVIELAGAPQSYKTLFSLYSILSYLLLNPSKKVFIVDTENNFDAARCLGIAKVLIESLRLEKVESCVSEGEDAEEGAMKVLDRIDVAKCFDSGTAVDAIVTATEAAEGAVGMAVIDSVVPLLGAGSEEGAGDARARAAEEVRQGANLVAFMRRLTALSRSSAAPFTIFIINGSVTTPIVSSPPPISRFPQLPPALASKSTLKPSLGTSFSYMTDITLWFTQGERVWGEREGRGRGVVEVARNRRGESGGWVAFRTDGIDMRALL